MIPQDDIDRVVHLLGLGRLSQRQIAHRVGVSRGTVAAIADGRRGHHGRQQTNEAEAVRAGRCPSCGVRVYLPCVACRAREFQRRTDRRGGRPQPHRVLRLAAAECYWDDAGPRVA